MKKSENTLVALETALERIVQGCPKRILATRKLSVRAVEEEASLGNGSGYYYPELVEKIKQAKADIATGKGELSQPEIQTVREKLNEQKRIKTNFKNKYEFPFELISDPTEEFCKHFDVIKLKKMYGKEHMGVERSTFLIDAEGVLRQEWRKVKVKEHVAEVLEAVKSL